MDVLKMCVRKRTYHTPVIDRIKLDNEISLVLESNPPVFPGEDFSKTSDLSNNPYMNVKG